METKICTGCDYKFPATTAYFPPDKRRRDGLCSRCRICARGAAKIYRQTEKGRAVVEKRRQTIKGHLKQVFSDAKQRCSNSKHISYKNYGGRGIKCLFQSADEFVDYVINKLKADPRGLQIDRIDNNGDYKPGNIRFVTRSENCKNRRAKCKITKGILAKTLAS